MLHIQQPPRYLSLPYTKYIQIHFDKSPPNCSDSFASHLSEWHHHSGVLARHMHDFSLPYSYCHCSRSTLLPSPTCLTLKAQIRHLLSTSTQTITLSPLGYWSPNLSPPSPSHPPSLHSHSEASTSFL